MRERAAAMVARAWTEAARVMPAQDAARVRDAVRAALAPRDAVLDDDHDPRCLAPGRVVRILIADALCRDADVLCAAAFIDSFDTELVGDPAVLSAGADRLRRMVPLPARPASPDAADAGGAADATGAAAAVDEDLLERLVTAEPEAALIAVAERLDQARHLHFRPEALWPTVHAQVRGVYIPVGHRISPKLAQRLHRWADAFERRRSGTLRRLGRTCEGSGRAAL